MLQTDFLFEPSVDFCGIVFFFSVFSSLISSWGMKENQLFFSISICETKLEKNVDSVDGRDA